jgi:hypothetical protein
VIVCEVIELLMLGSNLSDELWSLGFVDASKFVKRCSLSPALKSKEFLESVIIWELIELLMLGDNLSTGVACTVL